MHPKYASNLQPPRSNPLARDIQELRNATFDTHGIETVKRILRAQPIFANETENTIISLAHAYLTSGMLRDGNYDSSVNDLHRTFQDFHPSTGATWDSAIRDQYLETVGGMVRLQMVVKHFVY